MKSKSINLDPSLQKLVDSFESPPVLPFPVDYDVIDGVLVVQDSRDNFRFNTVEAHAAAEFLNSIDGESPVASLLDQSQLPPALAYALLCALTENGLIVYPRACKRLIPGASLASHMKELFGGWNNRLFSHELWVSLSSGRASQELFRGWLLETYHFIRGVNARLPLAIAECPTARLRKHFISHFVEEYDHHKFFAESLEAAGIPNKVVEATVPLPGTLAVINWTRWCARRDPLYYAGCSGLLESTGSSPRTARRFYKILADHYDHDRRGVIDPMLRHVALDEAYQHGDFMAAIFSEAGDIELNRAHGVVQATFGFVETLENWFSDIMMHYRSAKAVDLTGIRRYRAIN